MEELIALARRQLQRITSLCTQVGLKYVDLPPEVFGVGAAVGFGEAGFAILSVLGGGSEGKLMVTSGILKDIKRDRLAALNACNSFTSGNTLFPVYLHDAEVGWALLVQLTYTVDLLLDNPGYFDTVVRTVPQVAAGHRAEIAEKWDLGGQPFAWNAEDLKNLLIRSLM